MRDVREIITNTPYHYCIELDTVYGEENSYYFLLKREPINRTYFLVFSVEKDRNVIKKIKKYGKQNKGIHRNVTYDLRNHTLQIGVRMRKVTSPDSFSNLVSDLTALFSECDLIQRCNKSASTRELGIYRIGESLNILNHDAFLKEKRRKEYLYDSANTRYLRGYMAAVLGMAVGVFLWIIVGQLNMVTGLMGLAIINFGYLGFEKYGGRPEKKEIIMITIGAVMMIFIAEFLNSAVTLFLYIGDYSIVTLVEIFEVLPYLLMEPEWLSIYLGNLVIGLFLTVLTAFSTVRSKYKKRNTTFIAKPMLVRIQESKLPHDALSY